MFPSFLDGRGTTYKMFPSHWFPVKKPKVWSLGNLQVLPCWLGKTPRNFSQLPHEKTLRFPCGWNVSWGNSKTNSGPRGLWEKYHQLSSCLLYLRYSIYQQVKIYGGYGKPKWVKYLNLPPLLGSKWKIIRGVTPVPIYKAIYSDYNPIYTRIGCIWWVLAFVLTSLESFGVTGKWWRMDTYHSMMITHTIHATHVCLPTKLASWVRSCNTQPSVVRIE